MNALFLATLAIANVNVEATAVVTSTPSTPWCEYDGAPVVGDVAKIRLSGRPSAPPEWPYQFYSGSVVLTLGEYLERATGEYREDVGTVSPVQSYANFAFNRDGSPGTIGLPPERGDWPSPDVCFYTTETIYFSDAYGAGDANRDGLFNSSDLVAVFVAGEYEDALAINSTWETGDWTADGEFNTRDLVVAFQAGTYEQPAAAVAIPEPSSAVLLLLGILAMRKPSNRSARRRSLP